MKKSVSIFILIFIVSFIILGCSSADEIGEAAPADTVNVKEEQQTNTDTPLSTESANSSGTVQEPDQPSQNNAPAEKETLSPKIDPSWFQTMKPTSLVIYGGNKGVGTFDANYAELFVSKILLTAEPLAVNLTPQTASNYNVTLLGQDGSSLDFSIYVNDRMLKTNNGYYRISDSALLLAKRWANPTMLKDEATASVVSTSPFFLRITAIYENECFVGTLMNDPSVSVFVTMSDNARGVPSIQEIGVLNPSEYMQSKDKTTIYFHYTEAIPTKEEWENPQWDV